MPTNIETADMANLPPTLTDLLSNAVILRQMAPYIPMRGMLQLASTSQQIRSLLHENPDAWRRLDLMGIKAAMIDSSPIDVGGMNWRSQRMDEALCEDDFYAGPLRGIFGKLHQKQVLRNVQTLILDGLSVPADLVHEILTEDRYNFRVLSIRQARNLNQSKLQQALRYVVRPTRPDGTPKLKALYLFGTKETPASGAPLPSSQHPALGVMGSLGAQIGAEWNQRSSSALNSHLSDEQSKWYESAGRTIKRPASDWADTLVACKGLIAFDAVLCRGPRHDITKVDSRDFLQPTIATIALGPHGCVDCGSAPEGPAVYGDCDLSALPLLAPPPLHSASARAAVRPTPGEDGKSPKLFLRCEDCLRERWCEQCNRWWCEDCYKDPDSRKTAAAVQPGALQDALLTGGESLPVNFGRSDPNSIKVLSKLCVEYCLVGEMMIGAGSNGMWG